MHSGVQNKRKSLYFVFSTKPSPLGHLFGYSDMHSGTPRAKEPGSHHNYFGCELLEIRMEEVLEQEKGYQ